ncbi:MAG: mannose-phosphate guanylyltransferase [Blastocatellia bacterium]|jgi:NDP-sugar pyrophosphorylase family protein|nr:mannose-phosphate guanylyltransferase [Blastocatellia bacterium]
MILAAGYGTRLWPLTVDRTKPAIPFLGRPLVGYVAEYLARNGIGDVVVNLHHRPESVREALGDGSKFGVNLSYVEEPVILGPSGALDNARDLLDGGTFVVINGKIVTDIDLRQALKTHRESSALATLVLRENPLKENFTPVETRDGLITNFVGVSGPAAAADASPAGAQRPPLMFTGIHILEPRIFEYIPRGVFSHTITDVYLPAMTKGERIAAHVAEGMWYELSTIQRYLEISLSLMKEQGRDIEKGADCEIHSKAEVSDSILWDGVIIEDGATVHRAILGDGVRIRAGDVVENSAVVRAELVRNEERPAKALPGDFKGDNFVVPLAR